MTVQFLYRHGTPTVPSCHKNFAATAPLPNFTSYPKNYRVSSLTDCFANSVLCSAFASLRPPKLAEGVVYLLPLRPLFKTKKWEANELRMGKNAQRMRKRKNAEQLIVSHLCLPTSPPKKCAENTHPLICRRHDDPPLLYLFGYNYTFWRYNYTFWGYKYTF